ncbi:class D sortase [Terribacillus sp. 7520-G]|uniref:class D sortase n=1 Tax=Terribacillus TaxID=459532 RepID=UPI000BA7C689|nr:class D sortase [Terribacillus sp. 7520-G]PAD40383.1 class D sortase [Terribacillus sp. 7520-G]
MKIIGNGLILASVILLAVFGYQYFTQKQEQNHSFIEAEEKINEEGKAIDEPSIADFKAEENEAFAILEVPKLKKSLPIIEGTDPDDLNKGVGHLTDSVYPGQKEQIVLSGHRDTVFRSFGELELGDRFIVKMPYGTYTYEIKSTDIVPEDDTTVIRKMGEEVLVVTTCYPFHYVGSAPERFIFYAYPVAES